MYDKEKKKVKEQTTKDSYDKKGSYATISEMEEKCGGKASYSESGLRK